MEEFFSLVEVVYVMFMVFLYDIKVSFGNQKKHRYTVCTLFVLKMHSTHMMITSHIPSAQMAFKISLRLSVVKRNSCFSFINKSASKASSIKYNLSHGELMTFMRLVMVEIELY